jgi:hypothetical protein
VIGFWPRPHWSSTERKLAKWRPSRSLGRRAVAPLRESNPPRPFVAIEKCGFLLCLVALATTSDPQPGCEYECGDKLSPERAMNAVSVRLLWAHNQRSQEFELESKEPSTTARHFDCRPRATSSARLAMVCPRTSLKSGCAACSPFTSARIAGVGHNESGSFKNRTTSSRCFTPKTRTHGSSRRLSLPPKRFDEL